MRHKLIVDNFAGGGGTSTGIEMALGRSPDIAINHDSEAIAMHRANHPDTEHFCESVWEVDIKKVIQGQAVGLVWLSPDCKHFSKAKGSKPVEKNIRGLAWIALKWAALARPDVIILENVEEFITWGPLFRDENGLYYPNSKRKGEEFRKFCNALKQQGYIIEYQVIPAYIYGAPTIRKRLYLIARLDKKSIIWTPATHGKPDSMEVQSGLLQPWRTSGECIDWSIPCPSIFDRKKPLADATCRRVANGVMKYVVNNDNPFIVGIGGGAYSRKPVPTDRPFGTIAASGNNRYLVHPVIAPHISAYYGEKLVTAFLTEHANASSPRCFDLNKPMNTQCAQVKGGHFSLVSAHLAKNYTGATGSPLDESMHTVTSIDHHSLVTSHLMVNSTGHPGLENEAPFAMETTGNHIAEVRAFLTEYYGNGRGSSLNEPMHTATTKDRFGLVTINGTEYTITDIGLRMLTPRELFLAQGFPDGYIIGDNPDQRLKLTKTAQVRMCGNSVCPPVAAALVGANVPELAVDYIPERVVA